jgi:K+-sensing histidine kinase KdpD
VVETALFNVLMQAAKYAPSGSEIQVKCVKAKHRVVFEVLDKGPAISRDTFAKLYIKEDRQAAIKNIGRKGSGIGMYYASLAAKEHGGSLGLKNLKGAGVVVSLELPGAVAGG